MTSFRTTWIVLACGLLLSACGPIVREYNWTPYEIEAERVITGGELVDARPVTIINETNNGTRQLLGSLGVRDYYGSLDQLGDAFVTQISDELRKRRVDVGPNGEKCLRVKFSQASLERGVWVVRAHVRISVSTGDGYTLTRSVGNSTPTTVPRAYNGAVALAVIDTLNDSNIVNYLTSANPGVTESKQSCAQSET